MSRLMLILSAALASVIPVAAQPPSPPAPAAHVDGRQIVVGQQALKIKAIGLGNWLVPEGYMFHLDKGPSSPRHIEQLIASLVGPDEARRFWKSWRDTYVTRADLELLKRAGFNTIRVPFSYRLFFPDEGPDVFDADGFAPLDRMVRWSSELGLFVVLDMHGAPGGQTGTNIDDSTGTPWLFESADSQARMTQIWQRIADRYKSEPAVLAYELLNEPIAPELDWKKYNERLEPLYKKVTEAIRAIDPSHIIVLGGAQWNTEFSIFGPPFARNLVYAFHKYWSETTDESIKSYLAFREQYNVPIWLGETGENNDEWIAAAVKLSDAHDIGWAFWPYKKMDATSSVVSFNRPDGWDKVVAFAQVNPFDYEAGRKLRPSPDQARQILQQLLANVALDRCRVNASYVKALGLHP